MLGKLFKYEMKATARIFVPVYIAMVLLSGIGRLVSGIDLFSGELSWIAGLFLATYVFAIFAVFILTYVVVIQRFYKNLLSDEGYLMFTLPVKPSRLILSKLLASVLWMVCTVVAILFSLLVLAASKDFFAAIPEAWASLVAFFTKEFGGYSTLMAVELIVLLVVALFCSMLLFFVSIALGQLISRHKVAGAFAAYLLISFVVEIVMLLLLFLLVSIQGFSMDEISNRTGVTVFMPLILFLQTAFSLVYFFLTNFIFKKHLNLE